MEGFVAADGGRVCEVRPARVRSVDLGRAGVRADLARPARAVARAGTRAAGTGAWLRRRFRHVDSPSRSSCKVVPALTPSKRRQGRSRSERLARRVRRDRRRPMGVRASRHRRTCRTSVLTPVAKAELYTAKGSPVVDLALAPGAARRSPGAARRPTSSRLMAVKRGATTPTADHAREAGVQHRLGADPLQGAPGAGRARRRPAARDPRPADQGR